MKKIALALLAGINSVATPASAAPGVTTPVASVGQLYGHWQVVGVAVADDGVQALATNDPSYMGRRLTFSATRLSWDKPKQMASEAPCDQPRIAATLRDPDPEARAVVRKVGGPALRAFAVSCSAGPWGPTSAPAPAVLALRDGTIALWWFDGGLLKLRRVR